jgi:hypothetical protein
MKGNQMFAILEKNLTTGISEVHSIHDNKEDAIWYLENLQEDLGDDYEFKMISI